MPSGQMVLTEQRIGLSLTCLGSLLQPDDGLVWCIVDQQKGQTQLCIRYAAATPGV